MICRLLAALFRPDEGAGYDLTGYAAAVPPRPSTRDRRDFDPAKVAAALRATRWTLLNRPDLTDEPEESP